MNIMEEIEKVKLEIKDYIAVLSLDNPPQNKITNPEFIKKARLKRFLFENKAKALLIKGNGRHFSSGADLDYLFKLNNKRNILSNTKKGVELLKFISELEIPVISVIKGACFGGGLEIALSAHVRIAEKKSLFSFPELDLSLIPGLNGILRSSLLVGKKEALELVLSSDIIDAEKALKIGLIDYLVEEDCFEYAFKYAKRLVDNRDLKLINYVIRALNNSRKLKIEKAMKIELKMFTDLVFLKIKKDKKDGINS